jgi:hypothetical protein
MRKNNAEARRMTANNNEHQCEEQPPGLPTVEGRPYSRQAVDRARLNKQKNPAWLPTRMQLAQSVSFNFPNKLICATASSARADAASRTATEPC